MISLVALTLARQHSGIPCKMLSCAARNAGSLCSLMMRKYVSRYFVSTCTNFCVKKKEAVLRCRQSYLMYAVSCEKSSFFMKSVILSRPLFLSSSKYGGKTLNRVVGLTVSYKTFHTSVPRSAVPPVVWVLIRPLTKFLAVLFGRGFRKWWKALPKDKKAVFVASLKRNRRKIAVGTAIVSAGSYAYYDSHLQETPMTGRKRFVAFTTEQFNTISQFEFNQNCEWYKDQILPPSHPAYQQVVTVANRLLRANRDLHQIYNKEWTVTVVDDAAMKNAFVLPCGNIFVFTGMINLCSNADQLGTILGHEMAHAILGHAAEQVSFLHLVDLMFIIPVAAIWAFLPSDWIAVVAHWFCGWVTDLLLCLPYGRALEVEADEVGLQLAAKACFDVREASTFWMKMALMEEIQGGQEVEWLSTHPGHEKRHARLDELMDKAILLRQSCECPRLPKLDPRHGIENFRKALKTSGETKPVAVILQVPDMTQAAVNRTESEKSSGILHQK